MPSMSVVISGNWLGTSRDDQRVGPRIDVGLSALGQHVRRLQQRRDFLALGVAQLPLQRAELAGVVLRVEQRLALVLLGLQHGVRRDAHDGAVDE